MPMSPETLHQILSAGRTHNLFYPEQRMPHAPKRQRMIDNATPEIYTLHELPGLIKKLKTLDDGFDSHELKYSIRYLVTETHELLLGQEGQPDGQIPRHRDLAARCIAAGNLFFSDDFEKIIGINHDSGDFKPTMASLIWPLKQLAETDLLDDTQTDFAIHYRAHPEAEIETLTLEVTALKGLLTSIATRGEANRAASAAVEPGLSTPPRPASLGFFGHTTTRPMMPLFDDTREPGFSTP